MRNRRGAASMRFNPRPRVGGDSAAIVQVRRHGEVSIHAPAWGATYESSGLRRCNGRVSIHAPAWGATSNPAYAVTCRSTCFNPRPRVGGDIVAELHADRLSIVSIHAPAWGATAPGDGGSTRVSRVSIHAPAWGATQQRSMLEAVGDPVSIHAPAWGATQARITADQLELRFNPRPRVGGDFMRFAGASRSW